jgi:aminopeptidase N
VRPIVSDRYEVPQDMFDAHTYPKGALVLHMLRRLIGDEAFFSGVRAFYQKWRYSKAGTEDFRAAMEAASGRHLQRFFTQWIYESAIPVVRFTSRTEGSELHVHFEEKGDLYELPITVTITYADGSTADVTVLVDKKIVDRTLPLRGVFRGVEANRDGGALVEIEK